MSRTASVTENLADYESDDLRLDLRWWDALNYLTVGQIYLQGNALLREPLAMEHIKPRLLGHWGTSPGLSMIYVLLNRLINRTGSDWIYVTSKAPTPRSIRTSPPTPKASCGSSGSSPPPAGSPATSACRHRAASTRAASSGMRCPTPTAPPSTTPT